jgi:hypothetical protein
MVHHDSSRKERLAIDLMESDAKVGREEGLVGMMVVEHGRAGDAWSSQWWCWWRGRDSDSVRRPWMQPRSWHGAVVDGYGMVVLLYYAVESNWRGEERAAADEEEAKWRLRFLYALRIGLPGAPFILGIHAGVGTRIPQGLVRTSRCWVGAWMLAVCHQAAAAPREQAPRVGVQGHGHGPDYSHVVLCMIWVDLEGGSEAGWLLVQLGLRGGLGHGTTLPRAWAVEGRMLGRSSARLSEAGSELGLARWEGARPREVERGHGPKDVSD